MTLAWDTTTPKNIARPETGDGLNYTAQQLADFKAKHAIETKPTGEFERLYAEAQARIAARDAKE